MTSEQLLPRPPSHLEGRLVVSVGSVGGVVIQEDTSRVLRAGVVVGDFSVGQEDWYRAHQDDDPRDADGGDGVALGTDRHGGDGVDDGQEAIETHQYQSVDTRVSCDHDQVLDHLAPHVTEGPEGQDVVGGGEGHAEDDEAEVGNGEVDDEEVRGAAHLLVSGHHDHHQRVSEQSEDDDDAEEHGDDDADYLLHDAELRLHFVGDGAGGVARLAEGREVFTVVGRLVGTLSVADSLGRRAAPAPAHRDGRRSARSGRARRSHATD